MDFSQLRESYKRVAQAGTPTVVLVTSKVDCQVGGCEGHLTQVC
jgi:hypothetical protein